MCKKTQRVDNYLDWVLVFSRFWIKKFIFYFCGLNLYKWAIKWADFQDNFLSYVKNEWEKQKRKYEKVKHEMKRVEILEIAYGNLYMN